MYIYKLGHFKSSTQGSFYSFPFMSLYISSLASRKLTPVIFNIFTYLLKAHPPTTKAVLCLLFPFPFPLLLLLGCQFCWPLVFAASLSSSGPFSSLLYVASQPQPMPQCNSSNSLSSYCILNHMHIPQFWEGKKKESEGREKMGMERKQRET